jgi:DUF971 family protein
MTPLLMPLSLALDPTGLLVRWPDAESWLDSALLRRRCRCRDCRHTAPSQPNARLSDLAPVGAYGVQLHFDDGHDRGIYPWDYLRELAGLPPR